MVVATQTRRRETPMSHYQHLTISERESIWENKLAGKSLRIRYNKLNFAN